MKVVINILVVCAFVFTMFRTGEAFDNYDCQLEKDLVIRKCKVTIRKEGNYVPPNEKCRREVEHSDMTCICHILNHNDEKHVDPKKLVRLARECNKPVPVGYKCGSKFLNVFISS
jgi:hypothetical protein